MFAHKADILVRRALITRQGKRNILLYYFLRDIFFIPKSKINILPANKIKSFKIFSSKRFLRQSFKRNTSKIEINGVLEKTFGLTL